MARVVPAAAQFRQLVVAQAKLSRAPPVLLGAKVQGGEQVVEKVRKESPEQLKSEGRWASRLWRGPAALGSAGPPEFH